LSVPGCTQPDPAFVSNSTSPIGTSTTNASPTFSFGAGASGNCAVDYVNNIDHEDAGPDNDPPEVLEHHNYVPCNSTYASTGGTQQAQNPLSIGLHYFYFTPTGGNEFVRAFAIDAAANETTPPTVTFDSGPTGDTSDSTPSFAFHASESSLFQCSLDNGAYLPCTNGAAATSSTYDVTTALLASDDDHTLRVRASDSFGNLGVAVTRTFKIVIPFDPTYVADYSTAVARAHPTLDVDITSLSHEDLDKLTISLPDGYLGSLRGAAQCPKTVASAGNCGAESQIGTVETEAAIDQSIARVNGTVYLTGPQVDGDPAGISVKVPARIQDVNLGNIIVPIRLTVRGHVKGIDSIAVDIPHQIDPAASGNTFDSITQFDMRSIKLKLRNNPSASQPLLTNPSSCAATSFKAEYTGTNATKVTKTQPFQATACGNLGLAPQMTLSLLDATTGKPPKESSGLGIISATMTVDMTLDPNGSGISSASVLLPKPVTVNSSQLPAPCTAAQYDTGGAESCPASTKVGRVLADSPLLLTPLEGDVYLVKSTDPSVGLPRLLLALRGAINTDIFGNMRTIQNPGAASQIRTDFLDLPDAPLSSLHVKIDKVVSTRNEACQYTPAESIVQTSFSGFSGAAATSGNPISITCNGSGDGKFSNKGAKSTLSLNLRAPDGAKFKSFSFKLPKGLKFQKKGLKKGFTIKAGTKKLKVKCAKFSGTNKLSSTICKTYNQRIALAFKKGTLSATKKVKKPKISVTAVDTQNRKYAFVITAR
jgi:hypothetical protein